MELFYKLHVILSYECKIMNGKFLKQGGSSFIAKKRGHTPNLDDLKTANTISVQFQ